MKSRKSIKKNKPEARNLYVSESMLVECFDSVLYPVVLTKGSEILHQNLSAKMNKSLVTTLEDLLKKNADIEWITDENGGVGMFLNWPASETLRFLCLQNVKEG